MNQTYDRVFVFNMSNVHLRFFLLSIMLVDWGGGEGGLTSHQQLRSYGDGTSNFSMMKLQ